MLGRLSATTVLLRRIPQQLRLASQGYDYQILCQRRGGNISRAGMVTFPGGVHEEFETDVRTTALRELFEETGILLLESFNEDGHPQKQMLEWKKVLRDNPKHFEHIQSLLSSPLRRRSLHHFCTFATPTFEKRQYTTVFFICEALHEETAWMTADGTETESLFWCDPKEGLVLTQQKKIAILPPQFYVFEALSHFYKLDTVVSSLQMTSGSQEVYPSDVMSLKDVRGFPVMRPAVIALDSCEKTTALSLPFDEMHPDFPGKSGQRHRVYCDTPIGKGGEYRLQRVGV
jgi:8-oxo-dGTP pyrophosphatase MutT (NUDIX family)